MLGGRKGDIERVSKATWKFRLRYENGPGDVVQALRNSGLDVLEAESVLEALVESAGELPLAIRKDSPVDPAKLVQELSAAHVWVRWVNQPAA